MNIDEILAKGGDMTVEERAFLERELVKTARELHAVLMGLQREIADTEPRLAAKLRRHAGSLLENVERGAALPWPDGSPGALAD
jgi:hypothetical protein